MSPSMKNGFKMLRVALLLFGGGICFAHAAAETGNTELKKKSDQEEYKAPNNDRRLLRPMAYPQQPDLWYGNEYYPPVNMNLYGVSQAGPGSYGMIPQTFPGIASHYRSGYQPAAFNVLPAVVYPAAASLASSAASATSSRADNAVPELANFDWQSGVTVFDPNSNDVTAGVPLGSGQSVPFQYPMVNEPRWYDAGNWNPHPRVFYPPQSSYNPPTYPGPWGTQPFQMPVGSYYPVSTNYQSVRPMYTGRPHLVPEISNNPASTVSRNVPSGLAPERPMWKRSYTPVPGRNGCFNRCQPWCGRFGCQSACRQACNLAPNCGQVRPVYQGNTMVCPYGSNQPVPPATWSVQPQPSRTEGRMSSLLRPDIAQQPTSASTGTSDTVNAASDANADVD